MSLELLEKEKRQGQGCAARSRRAVHRGVPRQPRHPESYLIAVLQKVQDHFGYLGPEHMDAVSQLMQIPAAKVTGVATFYHFFTSRRRASTRSRSAWARRASSRARAGARPAEGAARHRRGGTTEDGLFSLEWPAASAPAPWRR